MMIPAKTRRRFRATGLTQLDPPYHPLAPTKWMSKAGKKPSLKTRVAATAARRSRTHPVTLCTAPLDPESIR